MPLTRLACHQRLRWEQPLGWLRSEFIMQGEWPRGPIQRIYERD